MFMRTIAGTHGLDGDFLFFNQCYMVQIINWRSIHCLPLESPPWVINLFHAKDSLVRTIEKIRQDLSIQVEIIEQNLSLYSDIIIIQRKSILFSDPHGPLYYSCLKAAIDIRDNLINLTPLFQYPWSTFVTMNHLQMGRTPTKWDYISIPALSIRLNIPLSNKYWCLYSLLHGLDDNDNELVSGHVAEFFIPDQLERLLSLPCPQHIIPFDHVIQSNV